MALVCHEFPPYVIGGVGAYTYNLARFLSKKKINVDVYCGKSRNIDVERIDDYLRIVRLPFPDFPLRAYWFQLRNLSYLSKQFERYDIVHGMSPKSASICVVFKKDHAKLAMTIHENPIIMMKSYIHATSNDWMLGEAVAYGLECAAEHLLAKLCLSKADKLFFVGNATLSYFRNTFNKLPEKKIFVIPNAIDLNEIERYEHLHQIEKVGHPSVLYFGRLKWQKGITYLLRAIARLQRRFPDIELRITGRGPMLKKILQHTVTLGIEKNVSYLGHLRRPELIGEIMRTQVVCLPSIYEGMSIAMLEAMAFRKPIVTFDLPFAREIIQDMNNGMLANPMNSNDLACKIGTLLEDESLRGRIGKSARSYVEKFHNWEQTVNQYINAYQS